MQWNAIVWFVLMIGFIALEAATAPMICLWFAAGALIAMIASLFSAPLWLQTALFFAVSVVLLLLLRPVFRKFIKPNLVRTNVDAVVGTQGVVTERIDNIAAVGQVKVGPMYWTARSTDNTPIEAGTQITVNRVEGVKVFVTPVKTPVQTQ